MPTQQLQQALDERIQAVTPSLNAVPNEAARVWSQAVGQAVGRAVGKLAVNEPGHHHHGTRRSQPVVVPDCELCHKPLGKGTCEACWKSLDPSSAAKHKVSFLFVFFNLSTAIYLFTVAMLYSGLELLETTNDIMDVCKLQRCPCAMEHASWRQKLPTHGKRFGSIRGLSSGHCGGRVLRIHRKYGWHFVHGRILPSHG